MSQELLEELVGAIPEVEAAFIIDEDGIIVHKHLKSSLEIDPEEIATQLVNPVRTIEEAVADTTNETDSVEELVIFTKKFAVFIYKLIRDTYLMVITRKNPLYGRTRFKLRTHIPSLIKSL